MERLLRSACAPGALKLPGQLTPTLARPHQVYDLARRLADVAVDDPVVELVLRPPVRPSRCSGGAAARRRSRCRGRRAGARVRPSSAAAGTRASPRASARRTDRAPWMSISSSTLLPCGERRSIGARGRAVAGRVVHRGPLEELPRGDHAVELGVVDEVVVLALDLAGRGARVVAETDSRTSGWCSRMYVDDRALADGGRTGEHDEADAPVPPALGDPVARGTPGGAGAGSRPRPPRRLTRRCRAPP